MKTELEEAAEKYLQEWRLVNNIHLSNVIHAERCKNDFIAGAKWQAKKMYSEEDLKEAFKDGGKMSWTDINQETQEPYYYDFNEWFKQFKK
jgi:hypothetical protein